MTRALPFLLGLFATPVLGWAASAPAPSVAVGTSSSAFRPTPTPQASLVDLLHQQKYLQAFVQSGQARVADETDALEPLARANLAPAMWLLGEQLFRKGYAQDAANWFYTALLTTRMDQALCLQSPGMAFENRVVSQFHPALTVLRKDPNQVSQALRFAIAWQAVRMDQANTPEWACMAGSDGRPPTNNRWLIKDSDWVGQRNRVFQAFRKQVGAGNQPCYGAECVRQLDGPTNTPADTGIDW